METTLQGYVLDYSVRTGEGVILGDDGDRYSFAGRDWTGPEIPVRGARVRFVPLEGQASEVAPVTGSEGRRSLRRPIGFGCAAALGMYLALGGVFWLVRVLLGGDLPGIIGFIGLAGSVGVGYLVYRKVRGREADLPEG